jgi:hypothetical protein
MDSTAKEASSKTTSSHATYYIDPLPLHLDLILTPPPARNSATTAAEFAKLHRIDTARTLLQITQAWADDQEEDIFVFKTVLGPTLPQRLPFWPRSGMMKVRPVVLSRQSIAGGASIRLTARFVQSAHSIRTHFVPERTIAFRISPRLYPCAASPREAPSDLRPRRRVCPPSTYLRGSLCQ